MKWKALIQELFSASRKERNGVMALVIFILVLGWLPEILPETFPSAALNDSLLQRLILTEYHAQSTHQPLPGSPDSASWINPLFEPPSRLTNR